MRRMKETTLGEILARGGLTIQGEATTGKPVTTKTFMPPASEINALLARAGLTIYDEAVLKQHPEPTLLELKRTPEQA